ncbi:MAG TPA: hypothetical protein VFS43_13060 [Polyangiaceae bacterium]|nr:hypothetical protein [Polyangiaceae bacterium]
MRRRPPFLAALGVALASLAGACGTDLEVDGEAFCRERPADAECRGLGGSGTGGAGTNGSGTGGTGTGGSGTGGSGGPAAGGSGGGACGDTQGDPNNCGECGRVCIGDSAACEGGACVPQTLADLQTAPHAIAVDDANVYWASPAFDQNGDPPLAVLTKGKDGSGTPGPRIFTPAGAPALGRALSFAFASTEDDDYIFFGSLNLNQGQEALFRVRLLTPFENTPSAPFPVNASEPDIGHIAASGDLVFWTGGGNDVARGKDADNLDDFVLNAPGQNNPGWITADAEDDGRAYWVAGGAIRRGVPGDEDDADDVVVNGSPGSVEVAGGQIYWTDLEQNEIRKAPVGGPLPADGQAIVTDTNLIEGFAVDAAAGRIYWVSYDPANKRFEVFRADLEGQGQLVLGRVPAVNQDDYAGNPFGPAYVVLDAEAVYFTDVGTMTPAGGGNFRSDDNGRVYRVAR